jgi:hypothetical protein
MKLLNVCLAKQAHRNIVLCTFLPAILLAPWLNAAPVTLTLTAPTGSTAVAGSPLSFSAQVSAQSGTLAPNGTLIVRSQVPHELCSARLAPSFGSTATVSCAINLVTTTARTFQVSFRGDVGWDDVALAPININVTPATLSTSGWGVLNTAAIGARTEVSAPGGLSVQPTAPITLSFGGASCVIPRYLTSPSCTLVPVNSSVGLTLSYPGDAHYAPINQVVGSASISASVPQLSVPASVTVSESATGLSVPITLVSGSLLTAFYRVRLIEQSALEGEDFISSDAREQANQAIFLNIVRDQRAEPTKTAQLEIYDVLGAQFDRTIIDVTLTDDDLAGQTFVVNSTSNVNDGCAVNGCTFTEAVTAANASLGADRIEFNLSAPGAIDVGVAAINSDITIDGRTQPGYVATTNLQGLPNGTMGVELRLVNSSLVISGRTEIYGVAISGPNFLDIRPQGETKIQGCFLGADRLGNFPNLSSAVMLQTNFTPSSTNFLIGGSLAAERNLIASASLSNFTGRSNARVIGNWIGKGTNNVLANLGFSIAANKIVLRNNDFFGLATLNGIDSSGLPSDVVIQGNNFSGPSGLALLFLPSATIGGPLASQANRFFNLTTLPNSAFRESAITLNGSNADLRGNLMGGNPGRAVLVSDKKLNTGNVTLLESSDDPFDADTRFQSGRNQRFQNAPEIISVARTATDVTLSYRVHSLPGYSSYPLSIEFFQASDDEGKAIIGRDSYLESEALSVKSITLPIPVGVSFAANDVVLATATDADGHSSSFNRYPMDVRILSVTPSPSATGELITVRSEFSTQGPVRPFGRMLVGFRGSVQDATPQVFQDLSTQYCRTSIAPSGSFSAEATCVGTTTLPLATNANAIFSSLSFDTPFALSVDQQAHTVRLPSADMSLNISAGDLSALQAGTDACEIRSYTVSARNSGPDAALATISLPRPTLGSVQDWRYTCVSGASVCGAISTGSTSLSTSINIASNSSIDFRIDLRPQVRPRTAIAMSGTINVSLPTSDPVPGNNSFSVSTPVTLFENGFEDAPSSLLCSGVF